MTRRTQRWLVGIGLALLVAGLRFPWLETDAGNSGIWAFGAFSSDEGEYTGGGRLRFLTGQWLDAEMGYPSTLTYAPAMHLLSAISYRVCGLTQAAARWPAAWAAVIAWLLIYHMASRLTAPWLAGIVTLTISCNPVSLTYERWGSSDVVFAAGIVSAWWLVRRPSPWRAAATGLVAAFALLAKTTAILFVPFLFAEILMCPRRRTGRACCFVIALSAAYAAGQFWLRHCVSVCAHGALNPLDFPAIQSILTFDVFDIFKALAVFPRQSLTVELGPFAFWLLLLPGWHLAINWWRTGRLCAPRAMLWAALFVYVGIMATQARNPSRYFLPLLYFTPLLLVHGRRLLLHGTAPSLVFEGVLLGVCLAIAFVYWNPVRLPAAMSAYFLCNEYVLPDKLAWAISWPVLVTCIALLAVVAGIRLGWRGGFRQWLIIGTLAVSTGWVFSSNYGYAATKPEFEFVANQLLVQLAVLVGFILVLGGRKQIHWGHWYGFAALLFFGAMLLNPTWRRAYPALLSHQYTNRVATAKIVARLPDNAVVIGRRASTLLEHTRMRLGLFTICSMGKNGAPALAQRLSRLLKSVPQGTVYWLVAADELPFYVSPQQKEITHQFQLELTDVVLVPGDQCVSLVPLYLIKIQERQDSPLVPMPPLG